MAETLSFDPDSKAVTLSEPRHAVCMQAVWELDALARLLPRVVTEDDMANDSMAFLHVRGVAGRMMRLSNALMAGLYDPVVGLLNLKNGYCLKGGANDAHAHIGKPAPGVIACGRDAAPAGTIRQMRPSTQAPASPTPRWPTCPRRPG